MRILGRNISRGSSFKHNKSLTHPHLHLQTLQVHPPNNASKTIPNTKRRNRGHQGSHSLLMGLRATRALLSPASQPLMPCSELEQRSLMNASMRRRVMWPSGLLESCHFQPQNWVVCCQGFNYSRLPSTENQRAFFFTFCENDTIPREVIPAAL